MFRTTFLISCLLFPAIASATTIVILKDGGTLEGELLNPHELSRKTYQMKTAGGLEISMDAKLVERVQGRERPALMEYNEKAHLAENTIENHLGWAKWCSEHQLPDQSRLHWKKVMELDSDHAEARRILGYVKERDGWVSLQEKREDRGYVQDRGRWKTAQQIEVENILTNHKDVETQWRRTIRDLIRRLPNSEVELLAIRDPAAIGPLGDALFDARNSPPPHVRMVLLRSLARIPHASAIKFVVGWSILPHEPLEEIRQMCVDELLRLNNANPEVRPIMIDAYRNVLRPTVQPTVINFAAKVLGDIGGYEAIPELIEVLVVTRAETIQPPAQTYSKGSGGMTLQQGGAAVRVQVPIQNPAVLATLVKLSGGGMNFQFNQDLWREWYRQSQRSPTVNLRRD